MSEIGKNMLLIEADWQGHQTFKMIPVTEDCPYVEVIYDRRMPMLCLISKVPVEKLTMLPRLNNDGDFEAPKRPRTNGKGHKEQRVFLKTFNEYYFSGDEQVKNFVNLFAVNADEFNIDEFLPQLKQPSAEILQNPDAGKILDEKGNPIGEQSKPMTEA